MTKDSKNEQGKLVSSVSRKDQHRAAQQSVLNPKIKPKQPGNEKKESFRKKDGFRTRN